MTKHWQSERRKMDEEGERLSQRLLKCRHALGYKQSEMAAVFEISLSTYLRWERYGPPNQRAHRGFIKLMLRKLKSKVTYAKAKNRKKAEIQSARLAQPDS